MTISRQFTGLTLAGLFLGLSLSAQAFSPSVQTGADIRRTGFGVPHIRAENERGLGFGIGYAYAQDNLCLLANEIVTVNGERSRYFGPEQLTVEERENRISDVFFQWLNTPQAVNAFWQAQPAEVRDLVEGYAAGYNRYLAERRQQGLPQQCQGEWVRDIAAEDLVKLTRRLLVEGGVGQFAEALASATPPQAMANIENNARAYQLADTRLQRFALDRGSNAVAVGSERSFNGRGMLLANPHFPWVGGMRFYQMHLTIPGKLDVMGAALPGLPMINIGFNQHLAWTHTVDSSKHFTLYRLQLDPKDPTRYLLDGQSLPLSKQTVTVQVKQTDGQVVPVSRDVYSSQFGPIVQWPGKLDWNNQFAYSLRDANLDNDRVLKQWYAMNRAGNLKDLQDSVHTIQGIPWVNTLAVDDKGQTLYMNLSVVPNVSTDKLARCSDPRAGLKMIVLDGSNSACAWDIDPHAAQKGIYASSQLPQLLRKDFVQHSNDSAWLANPAQPLTGFSPLISQDGQPLGLRSRFALDRLATLSKKGLVSVQDLQHMVMDDQVFLATQVVPDLLKFCTSQSEAALKSVCSSLKAWDGRANLESGVGLVHFQSIMQAMQESPQAWRVAFDPKDAQHTPRGLAIEKPEVAKALREAMLASAEIAAKMGLTEKTRWGDVQVVSSGGQQTPIHGGPGTLGIYNAIQSVPREDGKLEVVSGTSYLQVVTFDDKGPHAQGLLAFSLSSDPASKYSRDQTEAFSKKQWSVLPFTEQQIKADPQYQVQTVRDDLEKTGKVAAQ
ncbi:acylase [Pseudomonas fluorescens]|uniref:Acyl-homoserine lactone acylase PvdQ n=1 Tax=Pseudomonas fluorescens (strain Pf0-1) TaxID=205922 RepID=PVDQ_PSEPF|nr:acylase [Pseudomonas fluorescens]Q3KD51.1 RecName: Full=Acyl-homoserine lactone acylase PvdQ; Short=AHL acylase PvdQ; Short=Acyl-HSL acylase PvdQ; Contains: RecName: Full=Acyl-homoserine lactone acylase PvdQ subunit alpha; Short=Acyl-HSL acylase PvdQ subunit alpha; Contains: RecName: Full=Acyl-homoserine lactone acylase PvdQ subunit beta; Short=Acyl-HSL acylase PvdQ subunit beta; Flags: Precursor [Pseudomonas fluorescens Pf0-1]ABA74304.1 putative amidase [Pseudomonas fluorescens Pf0-1]MBY9025